MSVNDPILAEVTGPGMPFEIAERDGLRQFVNMPADLNLLIDAARRHGDKTFLVEGDRRLTFEQVFTWRDQLIPLLGIKRGDRVAICMRNRTEWIVAFMAAVKAGGIAALLNSRGSPAELVAMIEEVTPSVVLADSERAALLREGGYQGRIYDLTQPPEEVPHGHPELVDTTPPAPNDPAAILFTSGTTGRVKGAVLTHRGLSTGLLSMQLSGVMVVHNMARQYGMKPEELMAQFPQQAVLLVYPLFHISGLGSAFLSPLFAGSKVVIMRRWDAEEAVRIIHDEQITMFTGVPTMLWDMLHSARLADADLSSLRNVASGGQALPVNLLEEVLAVCPHAQMGTGYGMTECSGAIAQAVGPDFLRQKASAGRILPLVDVRIEAPDGRVLPVGEAGEIVVRGAQIMSGYWNRPEDTAAVLSPDGWLKTGDVGFVDPEGYVFIVDRTKDMVISGGENIYCAEVERVMGEMPGITECAAFGIPDERLGELLVAVVVAQDLTGEAIIHEVGEKLARYKAPGRIAFSNEPLPRNAVGKIDKKRLREMWPTLSGNN
ncbi:class I adenylate-forming enzyme family protein [Novosphingobium sp.]|uniref:class I adenylate-forming enzyme family protein n=1 Tax=Novosphingobium sp. TaxID=1874826 RepID=UPI0025EA9D07|nr:class I adenylate-forming enzyme family protein [Novosphingobium sp.]MCC6924683.1 acyl--CoA ligase [Novosphingobium sp.]